MKKKLIFIIFLIIATLLFLSWKFNFSAGIKPALVILIYAVYRLFKPETNNTKQNYTTISSNIKPYNVEKKGSFPQEQINYTSSNNHQTIISSTDVKEFKNQLNQTIAFVQEILRHSTKKEKKEIHRIFRKTNPVLNEKPLYNFDDSTKEVDLNSELYGLKDYQSLLNQKQKIEYNDNEIIKNGKIVGFEIGLTTIDGAPIAESYGFVDFYDIPPFDTWIYLIENYKAHSEAVLFCWVPKEYEEYMNSAIAVEILDSYFWLNEENTELNSKLMN